MNGMYSKTIIMVTILSDTSYQPQSIESLGHDIIHGDLSGSWEIIYHKELTDKECAEELIKQGSDPSFLLGEEYE